MSLSKLISSVGLLALAGSLTLFPRTAPAAAPFLGWVFLLVGIGAALVCFYLAWRIDRR